MNHIVEVYKKFAAQSGEDETDLKVQNVKQQLQSGDITILG